MNNLIKKILWDKRFFILGWSLGVILLSYSVVIFFPAFSDSSFDTLTAEIPPEMQGFVGELDALKQLDTYLATQVYGVNLPILLGVLAILLALGLTVGEEDKGRLRTLVSLPLSRRKILFGNWSAIVLIPLIVSLATAAGVYLGVWQIGETIGATAMIGLTLMSWLLTVAIATLVYAIGLSTGSRAATVTVGVVVVAVSYLLTTFAQGVEWLKGIEWLSILHYFPANDIAKGTMEVSNAIVYGALIILALILTAIVFPRRDIKS